MNKVINFVLALMTIASATYATEQYSGKLLSVEERKPNHLYIGPELFGNQLHVHVKDSRVRGTEFFSGLRIGYEYLTPESVYAGIDFQGTCSRRDFKAHSRRGNSLDWHKADREFRNLELRVGYTFSRSRWLVTPYLGVGYYILDAVDHHNHQGFKESLPYAAAGARAKYAFNSSYDLGLNAKLLHTVDSEERFRSEEGVFITNKNMWGAEVGVPFVWHFGKARRWDVKAEPYYLRLQFSEIQNIFGARALLGYRF
jgi:hypothetical protein